MNSTYEHVCQEYFSIFEQSRKAKSFFFFNFEQFREKQRIAIGLTTVPTADYRAGNFSAAFGPQLTIYD